jgi:hypothetical protein
MPSAPYLNDVVQDQALQFVIDQADRAVYLNGAPTDYAEADTLASNGGVKMAERNLSTVGFDGPVDGDTSGRKNTLLKAGFLADETGSITQLAILDDDNSRILQIFVVDDGSGNPVSVTENLAYNNLNTDLEIADPS